MQIVTTQKFKSDNGIVYNTKQEALDADKRLMDKLVAQAKEYNSCSIAYAQSRMYAMRNEVTSIDMIAKAVNIARNIINN